MPAVELVTADADAPACRRGTARSILAVDDSRAALAVLGRCLAHLGHTVVQSESGAEALDLIAARHFDLVLLDMVMPGLSGMHVLREIRGARTTIDLPVIVITGRTESRAIVDAFAAGADDHVAKPYPFEILAARIERVLARSARLVELKRAAMSLDARLALRAVELGEARAALAEAIDHGGRLDDEVKRLRAA